MPPEAVRRVTEGAGAVAEADQQTAITQAQQGQQHPAGDGVGVLGVAVDGVQVPLEEAWQEWKVRLGPAVCCAGLETAETFWYRVYTLSCRGGWGLATRVVVVLGDGAEWIWKRTAPFVGGPHIMVIEIVDIFHAYEPL